MIQSPSIECIFKTFVLISFPHCLNSASDWTVNKNSANQLLSVEHCVTHLRAWLCSRVLSLVVNSSSVPAQGAQFAVRQSDTFERCSFRCGNDQNGV